jgi:hypothetical protein
LLFRGDQEDKETEDDDEADEAEVYVLCLFWEAEQRGEVEQPNSDSVRQEDEAAGIEGPLGQEGDCNIIRMVANKFFGCFLDARKALQQGIQGQRGLNKLRLNRGILFWQHEPSPYVPEHGLSRNCIFEYPFWVSCNILTLFAARGK